MRILFSFLLIFKTLLVSGQEKDIPIAINVPAGRRLIQHTYAKGVQVYVCTMDPIDSSRFTWSYKEPRAGLYAEGLP